MQSLCNHNTIAKKVCNLLFLIKKNSKQYVTIITWGKKCYTAIIYKNSKL